MTSTPELSWKETRPGRWERPQTCLEKINLINRNVDKAPHGDNWAKAAVAKLDFDPLLGDPEAALRIAWKQVRYKYPEVAAFPYDGTYMYRVGDPDQVALWVSATFSVASNTTVDNLFGHIPRNEQMMCYFLPETSEVLVRSPHYRLDARGAIFCLNYLIKSLANLNPVLTFGGCAKNLSPSIELALNIPFAPNPKVEEMASKRLAALEPHHPLLELNPTVKNKLPGVTRRRVIKLSKSETNEILSGCAPGLLQMRAAIHAALVAAVAKLAPPNEAKSFMAEFHCDLRFLISDEVSTKEAPTSCTSVITTEVDVSPSTSFESYYKQLAPVYAAGYTPFLESTARFHEKLAESKYSQGKATGEVDNLAQPRYGPLGVIEDQLETHVKGVVRVKDFWIGAETLTKTKMVHSWIWEDQIVLSCCYNDSFWEDAFVDTVLATVKDTLMTEFVMSGMMSRLAF